MDLANLCSDHRGKPQSLPYDPLHNQEDAVIERIIQLSEHHLCDLSRLAARPTAHITSCFVQY